MRILVAYDGSPQSDQVLCEALNLAEKFKGSIAVLNVYWNESESERSKMLENAKNRLMETFVKYEFISEKNQSPPECIVNLARDRGFDVIAIGRKGRHGAKERLLGSVASKVIEGSSCSVFLAE